MFSPKRPKKLKKRKRKKRERERERGGEEVKEKR
jgi:hypothetical protein